MKSPTRQAALDYASRGWFVLPVWWPKPDGSCACGQPNCTDIGKHPITQRGQHDATRDLQQIEAWWSQHPEANIGIALAPSGLVAFDVDKPESYAAWAEIEQKYGEPRTSVQVSGSGCHHIIFKRPAFPIKGSYDKRITLRGNNFIVAAPSRHKSGGYYRWQDGYAPWQTPPIELAPALAEAIRRPDQAPTSTNHDYPPAPPALLQEAFAAMMKHGPEIKGTSPQGHTRAAWGILVNDYALSPNEATPLIRAYNAMCQPPWPEEKLFSSPCRAGQTWNGQRGERRDAIEMRGAGAGIQGALGLTPKQGEEWLDAVALSPQPPVVFYPTGFGALDTLLSGGFATRSMTGLIAPPSTGKSAMMGHWILTLEKQRPVLHCSLELPKHELFVRYASHEMRFPWVDGVKGKVDQLAMVKAVKGKRIKLMGADDFDRLDPFGSLEAAVARMTQECGIAPIVVIDYIQIMARAASTEMRHKVGELTMRGRQLAQRADTVVLGVFTTQRDKYAITAIEKMRQAQDPRAYLGAAKESGDIEFDCAVLMYLDVDMSCKTSPKPAQIAVARCRYGTEGFVGLRAQLEFGSFAEDESALAEFASEVRTAKREADEAEIAVGALLDAVRTMPGRPWRDLQAKVSSTPGVKRRGLADLARDKLIADGSIVEVIRYDEHGRKARGKMFEIRNSVPPPDVSSEEEES